MKATAAMRTLPLVLLATATTAAVVGATLGTRPAPPKPLVASANPKAPDRDPHLGTLIAQLHRRFSDTRDVDFGFSRISRPKAREHYGPAMDRNDLVWDGPNVEDGDDRGSGYDRRLIREKKDGFDLKTEAGTWIDYHASLEQMRPENTQERVAIRGLLKDQRELAIYTFGAFDSKGRAQRLKGPAYLRQLGPIAPKAEDLADVASETWKGETPTILGFLLHRETIFAERQCVKCHNEMNEFEGEAQQPKTPLYKVGDRLGLLLIAEKVKP